MNPSSQHKDVCRGEDRCSDPPGGRGADREWLAGPGAGHEAVKPEHARRAAEGRRNCGYEKELEAERVKQAGGAVEDACGEVGQASDDVVLAWDSDEGADCNGEEARNEETAEIPEVFGAIFALAMVREVDATLEAAKVERQVKKDPPAQGEQIRIAAAQIQCEDRRQRIHSDWNSTFGRRSDDLRARPKRGASRHS